MVIASVNPLHEISTFSFFFAHIDAATPLCRSCHYMSPYYGPIAAIIPVDRHARPHSTAQTPIVQRQWASSSLFSGSIPRYPLLFNPLYQFIGKYHLLFKYTSTC